MLMFLVKRKQQHLSSEESPFQYLLLSLFSCLIRNRLIAQPTSKQQTHKQPLEHSQNIHKCTSWRTCKITWKKSYLLCTFTNSTACIPPPTWACNNFLRVLILKTLQGLPPAATQRWLFVPCLQLFFTSLQSVPAALSAPWRVLQSTV